MVPKRQTDLQLQRAQNDLPSPGCLANIRRMKWIPTLILSLLIVGVAHAEGPDDQYLEIYNWITQADTFSQTGDSKHAIANYSLAQDGLKKLQSVYSTWNPDIVKFRLEYVAERLAAATKQLPPVIADTSTNAPKTATRADLQQQAADLAEQVSTLAAEKAGLEKKLKEAFSLQPAPANSADLAKAQQEKACGIIWIDSQSRLDVFFAIFDMVLSKLGVGQVSEHINILFVLTQDFDIFFLSFFILADHKQALRIGHHGPGARR